MTPRGQGPVLVVDGVAKAYGSRRALVDASVTVPRGEIVALLGPNGAGKTTLVSIVAGLVTPDAGRVTVDGIDVLREPQRAQSSIGLAPQATGVYEPLTVEDNLRFFGQLAGLGRRALAARIDAVCDALLLERLRRQVCQDLSGGEKRRVHTAIALMARPPLLMLDEPTVGADISTRAALVEVVRVLAGEGTGVLYSTHYLQEVDALGACVVMLERGRVIASGPVPDLVGRHGSGSVELHFSGAAPPVRIDGLPVARDGECIRVVSPDPGATVVSLIEALGTDAARLRRVDVVHASLDSVFLTLTGERWRGEEERGDVAVA